MGEVQAARRDSLNYKLALPVAAMVVAALGLWIVTRSAGPADPGGRLVAELEGGSEVWTGELDTAAFEEAQAVTDLPVLWLGAEFEGYALTKFQDHAGVWLLVYGACKPPRGTEPSCVTPIQIQMRPPGGIPGNNSGPGPFRGVHRTPGESGPGAGGMDSWVVWLPGGSTAKVYVRTFVTGDITERLMESLRSANHEAMGYEEVGPGDSLAGML